MAMHHRILIIITIFQIGGPPLLFHGEKSRMILQCSSVKTLNKLLFAFSFFFYSYNKSRQNRMRQRKRTCKKSQPEKCNAQLFTQKQQIHRLRDRIRNV